MIKFYFTYFCKVFCLLTVLVAGGFSVSASVHRSLSDTTKIRSTKPTGSKITDTRKDKPSSLSNGVKINFVPFKPADLKAMTPPASAGVPKNATLQDNKMVTDLKVYPIPVEDQINFSFHTAKDANVTIKIMDLLGNEITTLLSQKLPAGAQFNSFNIASKLSSGIYFVRIVVGNEPIVKRISVL